MFDYKLLSALAAVVEQAGFERGAQVLGVSQSAISQRIKLLEARIGQPVLVRAARPVPALLERWGFSAARDEAMAYLWAPGEPRWTVRFFSRSLWLGVKLMKSGIAPIGLTITSSDMKVFSASMMGQFPLTIGSIPIWRSFFTAASASALLPNGPICTRVSR